jgi:hypothetical protein
VELKIKNQKVLYGTFYVPSSSLATVWLSLEYSIELSLNSNADAVFVVGDFNDNQSGPTSVYVINEGLFVNIRSIRD